MGFIKHKGVKVKQKGMRIIGDLVRVDDYTSDWASVRLHPTTYYRRLDEIESALCKSRNMYTQMDFGDYILIRFADNDDLTSFYKFNYEYT